MFTGGVGDLEGLCNAAVVKTLTVLITRGFSMKCLFSYDIDVFVVLFLKFRH